MIGGESSLEKNSFLNRTTLVEEEIGVSFKSLECIVNDKDSYKLIMWDLNPAKDIFGFMYPQFCRGAKACFLFFDFSRYDSFSELPYWISLFRNTLGENIPIILIGTLPEIKVQEVYEEDIEDVIKRYHLYPKYFKVSNKGNKKKKKRTIYENLIKNIDPNCEIEKFKIISPLEDQKFIEFFIKFARCPICNRKNHESYLAKFFYSQEDDIKNLRQYLLDFLDESRYHPESYKKRIKLGIPCCSCYRLIFES
ncbi:MAG: hypothetical protein ACFFBP_03110 [Promethearchaeota archaeon]